MKKYIFILLVFTLVGCSNSTKKETSQNPTEDSETSVLPKASSPPEGLSQKKYVSEIEEKKKTKKEADITLDSELPKRSCNTPLGEIPHNGQLTGFIQATVQIDEICVADTVRCNDGKWTGQGIHPTCKKAVPKPAK